MVAHAASQHSRVTQGFNLHFKSADDKTLRLRDWDTWLYGNLVIFASGIQGGCHALLTCHFICYAGVVQPYTSSPSDPAVLLQILEGRWTRSLSWSL